MVRPAQYQFWSAMRCGCNPVWVGRPESFRRYYDLPAVGFSFGSFQIEFGAPASEGQLLLDGDEALKTVRRLMSEGLKWATNDEYGEPPQTPEWATIVEALAQLAPPQKGPISLVEVSGALAGRPRDAFSLTRTSSDRIGNARKRLSVERHARTHEGFVREFDKDKLTFILRTAAGDTIQTVGFTEDQYRRRMACIRHRAAGYDRCRGIARHISRRPCLDHVHGRRRPRE